MKRISFIMAMFALFAGNALAQEYHPFIEDGKAWICEDFELEGKNYNIWNDPYHYEYFKIVGDTAINDVTYAKLLNIGWSRHLFMGEKGRYEVYFTYDTLYAGALRESERRVWFWRNGDTEERLLYDFNMHVGDEYDVSTIQGLPYRITIETDALLYLHEKIKEAYIGYPRRYWYLSIEGGRKFDSLQFFLSPCIIEGLGCVAHPFYTEYWPKYRGDYDTMGLHDCFPYFDYTENNYPKESYYNTTVINGPVDKTRILNFTSERGASVLHDLQGRRLTAEPQHGVFIKGGKKVAK